MDFYIKQKVFSWGDKFTIYDKNGESMYTVEGEIFTWGKKLHLYDRFGQELSFIKQEIWTFLPKYYIMQGEQAIAEVKKEFTFFVQEYTIQPQGWTVEGDFFAHEYSITGPNGIVAEISKEWFSWGDAYEIHIVRDSDVIVALSTVIIIDAVLDAERSSSSST